MGERLILRVGNADATELRRGLDPQTGQEVSVWSTVPGELVTEINLEPDLAFMDQLQQVVRFLQEMMTPGSKPWWFECDDEALRTALYQHYGIPEHVTRPHNWGDGTTTATPDTPAPKPPGFSEDGPGQTPEEQEGTT